MTREEELQLIETNKKLQEALEKATQPPPVQLVTPAELAAGRFSLADIDSGKVGVKFPEPEETEKRDLKDNEIKRSDQRRMGAHLEELASGKMVLADVE